MNQSDIFRLLLIILLMANSQLGSENNDDACASTTQNPFSYEKINEFLIFTMVLSPFSTGNETTTNTTF